MSGKEPPVSEAVELEPCPFCGASPYIRQGVNGYGHCQTDGCHANRAQVVALDDPRQIAAWNRRANPPEGEPVAWPDREAVARAIADGFSHGCEPYAEAPETLRFRYDMAADAILALLSASAPKGYKLVPVEPTEAMLAAARVAPTNSFRSHDPHYSDYADAILAFLSASDGAGTEGGVG